MRYVIDTSAAINLAVGTNQLDDHSPTFYAPELIDIEFAHVLRKLALRDTIDARLASDYLAAWAANDTVRCSHRRLLPRIWDLRTTITSYDAAFVALAEFLRIPLLTADRKLAHAARGACDVQLLG